MPLTPRLRDLLRHSAWVCVYLLFILAPLLVLLWPTLGALWLAAGGFPGWHLLAVFVLGRIGVLTA